MADSRRKDNRNRTLKVGESQRKDGQYQYRYTDAWGKRAAVYSWKPYYTDENSKYEKNSYDGQSI